MPPLCRSSRSVWRCSSTRSSSMARSWRRLSTRRTRTSSTWKDTSCPRMWWVLFAGCQSMGWTYVTPERIVNEQPCAYIKAAYLDLGRADPNYLIGRIRVYFYTALALSLSLRCALAAVRLHSSCTFQGQHRTLALRERARPAPVPLT